MLIRDLIDKFVLEMNGGNGVRGLKPLGKSHLYTLELLKRSALGKIDAHKLSKQDIKAHCMERIKTVVPATINQDVCYLSGVLKYAGSEWDDCEGVSDAAIAAARISLVKHNLIGKSQPRKRRPTDDELSRLLDYFAEADKRSKIKMTELIAFALASTRRISEICRMTHGDIEWDFIDKQGNAAPMYTVRDLKHPTKKKGNDCRFPMLDPMPEILRRQPRLNPNDPTERVFPFNAKSAGQCYTRAKKELGIENLRFHDCRRESITRWLKILPPHKVKLISGHKTIALIESTYDAQNADELHGEVATIRAAA